MALHMSKALLFISVLLLMSNLLNCCDSHQLPPQCRNAAQKVLNLVQSMTVDKIDKYYGEVGGSARLDKKEFGGISLLVNSSMTEFCGISSDLKTIADATAVDSANIMAFRFDLFLHSLYVEAQISIDKDWLPNLDSDPLAKITVISCGGHSQNPLIRRVVDFNIQLLDIDTDSHRFLKIDYILNGSNDQQIPILLVLQGDNISQKTTLPAINYPHVELQGRPKIQPSRANYTSRLCGVQGKDLCCLDSVLLNVKTQLNGTELEWLNIVEPPAIRVHFCRSNPNAFARIKTRGQSCCVPMGFNFIPVVTEDSFHRPTNKRLENFDARGCRCGQ